MPKGVTHIAQRAIVKLAILVALTLTVAIHHEASSLPAVHFTALCCPCIGVVVPAASDDRHAPGVRLIPGDDPALKKTDALVSLRLLISRHVAHPHAISANLPGRAVPPGRDTGCLPMNDRPILNCSLLI